MSFLEFIESHQFHTFLLDVSGVLYSDASGCFPEAVTACQQMHEQGQIFLVTNNTCESPQQISSKLQKMGIDIPVSHVISSGLGLHLDVETSQRLSGKSVFWVGNIEACLAYLDGVDCQIVTELDQADVMVIASSHGPESGRYFDFLEDYLIKRPIPVICCNPDHFVRGEAETLFPVAGFYAHCLWEALESVHPNYPFYWIGKPHSNFSGVVRQVLESKDVVVDSKVCFFDDNSQNISTLTHDLTCQGCWIYDTGIGFKQDALHESGFRSAFLGGQILHNV
jgi:ribonucleotide monophosphatase NagD (HAD superfamily)